MILGKRAPNCISVVAFLLPLVVYLLTLAREITFADSGELAAVAARLGIAHPPGYPLFTLLGYPLTLLPVSTVAFRVGLLSALAAAAACLLLYRTGLGLLRDILPPAAAPVANQDSGRSRPALPPLALALAPLPGALLFAFARTVWSQAVIVEVYTLQALLLTLFLAACARAASHPATAVRHWPLVCGATGLCLANHLTGILLLPALLFFAAVCLADRARAKPPPPIPWLRTAALAAAPLLLYLYLPVRSRMDPLPNWDAPETLHRFLAHVTARQYQGLLGREGLRQEELGRFLTEQLPGEASWVLLCLAGIGLGVLLGRAWRLAGVTVLAAGAILVYNLAYPIHDLRVYYVPWLAICGLWASLGGGWLVYRIGKLRLPAVAPTLLAVLVCLTCLFPLLGHWEENDQHDFTLLGNYTRDALQNLAPEAIAFSGESDSFTSPATYYQLVEGIRPDVLVLDLGALASPVLQQRLARARPALAETCRAELAAVAEIARRSEAGLPVEVEPARARYRELRRKLARTAVAISPTYITPNLYRHRMFAGFHQHPEGLLLLLAEDQAFRPSRLDHLIGPRISLGQARNRQERELLLQYARMLRSRITYLERHGFTEDAAALAGFLAGGGD